MPLVKYTDDENVLLGYLRHGTPEERIRAICYLGSSKKNYDLFWEIFLSDEDKEVRHNALSAAMISRPDKIWEILKYLIKTIERYNVYQGDYRKPQYINDDFINQVAKKLNELHQDGKLVIKK